MCCCLGSALKTFNELHRHHVALLLHLNHGAQNQYVSAVDLEFTLQAVEGLFEDELKHGRQREAWRVGLWFAYRKSGRLSGDVGTRLSGKKGVTKQGLRDRGALIKSLFIHHKMAKC